MGRVRGPGRVGETPPAVLPHEVRQQNVRNLTGATPSYVLKKGDDVGKTKVGKGMHLEFVVDADGLPLPLELELDIAGTNVCKQDLLLPALTTCRSKSPTGRRQSRTRGTTRTRCGTIWNRPGSSR